MPILSNLNVVARRIEQVCILDLVFSKDLIMIKISCICSFSIFVINYILIVYYIIIYIYIVGAATSARRRRKKTKRGMYFTPLLLSLLFIIIIIIIIRYLYFKIFQLCIILSNIIKHMNIVGSPTSARRK